VDGAINTPLHGGISLRETNCGREDNTGAADCLTLTKL
jgi:hypothetical protein